MYSVSWGCSPVMNNLKDRMFKARVYVAIFFSLVLFSLIQIIRSQGIQYYFLFIACFGPLMIFLMSLYDDKKMEREKNGRNQDKKNP